jgi:hypothetical protein
MLKPSNLTTFWKDNSIPTEVDATTDFRHIWITSGLRMTPAMYPVHKIGPPLDRYPTANLDTQKTKDWFSSEGRVFCWLNRRKVRAISFKDTSQIKTPAKAQHLPKINEESFDQYRRRFCLDFDSRYNITHLEMQLTCLESNPIVTDEELDLFRFDVQNQIATIFENARKSVLNEDPSMLFSEKVTESGLSI